MATISSGLGQLDPAAFRNPVLEGMQQGLGAAQQIMMLPYQRQQALADIQAKQALAQMNLQRGGYYDQYGNYRQSQADVVNPALADKYRNQADFYGKGGEWGATIDYLSRNKTVPREVVDQAETGLLTRYNTPEVKRSEEYGIAKQFNDATQAASINAANLKATSNPQLLKQQSAMEQMDAAVKPMIGDIDNAVSYYSGPGGALRLRADQIKQAAGQETSPEYSSYVLALQTQIPLIADNAAKVLGVQRSDAMQRILTMMVGPGEDPSMKTLALMPPTVVGQKLNQVVEYLTRESEVGRNFVGPLSLDGSTNQQLNNDLSGIETTMQNQQANQAQQGTPTATQPPAGMTKEQYFQWLQQNGGA